MIALLSRFDRAGLAFLALTLGAAALTPVLALAVPRDSPFAMPPYVVALLGKYLCYAILALALDLVWGYCGILSLGHGAQALRAVSLKAEIGRVTCVLGRNGVGKSSLLRAIIGQEKIARGAVRWMGEDVAALPPHLRARRGFGYAPQGREIFPLLTVRENLMTGFAALPRDEREIDEGIFSLFPVLADMLGRRGGDLSGGQQQQLAIARALVTRPKLLALDEPTEGIQPSIIRDIGRAILHLKQRGGMAILVVEQYFEWARDLADDYAVMERGAVVLAGERKDMVESEVRKRLSV
jgi:urea transport system ATP-binding protein